MIPRSFVLIANPHAGRGRAGKICTETTTALLAAGAAARGTMTTSSRHAAELAARAAEAGDVAVAVGGDGLLRAVAAGASQHRGTVGMMPCGRGNDFARTVGITNLDRCVKVLLEAAPRPADCIAVATGLISDTPSHDVAIGNVYVGFDSLSNVLANKLRVNLGRFAYSYTALHVALTMRPLTFRVVADGGSSEYTGSGVAIANSAYYGCGIPLAPSADVHDGLLDVLMFEQTTRRGRVAMMLAMRNGTHRQRPDVRHLRAQRIQILVDPPLEAYSDGDPIGRTPLTAWVLPGAIQILRP